VALGQAEEATAQREAFLSYTTRSTMPGGTHTNRQRSGCRRFDVDSFPVQTTLGWTCPKKLSGTTAAAAEFDGRLHGWLLASNLGGEHRTTFICLGSGSGDRGPRREAYPRASPRLKNAIAAVLGTRLSE
jgi:hypothetical protein